MSSMRLEELWARWMSPEGAGLDSAEQQELAQAIAADPGFRAERLEDARIDGAIAALARVKTKGELFARNFGERVRVENDAARFASALEHRIRRESRGRTARLRLFVAGLGVAAALGTVLLWRAREPGTTVDGDFQVFRAGALSRSRDLQTGDRVVAGPGGARLTLGGYCRLGLGAGTDVLVSGRPGGASIGLRAGRVVSRVTPGRGGFRVDTDIGSVEVLGTEFTTEVERPPVGAGTAVRVGVQSGRVLCQFGADRRTLGAGESHLFGEHPSSGVTEGEVTSGTDEGIVVQAGSESLTLSWISLREEHAESGKRIVKLLLGTPVRLSWIVKDGQRLVTAVQGRFVGRVVRVEGVHLEVEREGSSSVRLLPRYIDATPGRPGGHDTAVVDLIRRQTVGASVEVTWGLDEGIRLLDIKPAD